MTDQRQNRQRDAVQKQIDENLRRVYEEDATEAVPERFLELLQKLRDQG